jgi:hypothetical protein
MLKFSVTGVKFSYAGDTIFFRWSTKKGQRWWSENYLHGFDSLREYWKYVGSAEKDIIYPGSRFQGYSYLELLTQWVGYTYGSLNIVVLKDLNPQAKGLSFWARIPREKATELLNDVVVLHCSDKAEVNRLVDSIGEEFADAYGFSNGRLINFNIDSLK